jgi:hypothetical protein
MTLEEWDKENDFLDRPCYITNFNKTIYWIANFQFRLEKEIARIKRAKKKYDLFDDDVRIGKDIGPELL